MSSATHFVNHNSRGFLNLECADKVYPFEGIDQFWRIWNTQSNNTQEGYSVLFTNVNEDTFTREFLNSEDKIITRSWNSYDNTNQLLLVKMPITAAHERASRCFDWKLVLAANSMGVAEELHNNGAATAIGDGGGKQPDSQYLPSPLGRRKKWPTVVLEVAVSDTPTKLMSDIKWWLRQGDGAVEVVITIRADHEEPKVTLEKWGRNSDGQPQRHSSVTVYRHFDQPKVDNGPLVIEFDKLFGRSPDAPKEKDIILGDEELKSIAEDIWDGQGFCDDDDDDDGD